MSFGGRLFKYKYNITSHLSEEGGLDGSVDVLDGLEDTLAHVALSTVPEGGWWVG